MANNAETLRKRPVLLLTRPQASAVRFAARINPAAVARADLVISPLLEIVPVEGHIDLGGFVGVIFTSANGVRHAPEGEGRSAHCVGKETAEAARAQGWRVEVVAEDAEKLVGKLVASGAGSPLCHLSGVHQRGDIADRLTAAGIPTTRQVIYDQRPLELSAHARQALGGEAPVVLPLFSPRTAAQFVAQSPETARVHVIAMSDAVAQALGAVEFAEVQILSAPTGEAMRRAVELRLTGNSLP